MKKHDKTAEYLEAYADQAPDKDGVLGRARAALPAVAERKKPRTWIPVLVSAAAMLVVLVLGVTGLLRLFGNGGGSRPGNDAVPQQTYYTAVDVGYRTATREEAEALTGLSFGTPDMEGYRLYSFKTGGDAMVRAKLRFVRGYGIDEVTLYYELTEATYRPVAQAFGRTGTFYENGEYVTRESFRDNFLIYLEVTSPSFDAAQDYLPHGGE